MSLSYDITQVDLTESRFATLREIPSSPQRLFARGSLDALEAPLIAIVGTRRPSPYGMRAAIVFAKALAAAGCTIVSGLARGIDGGAHRGALVAKGRTVAVLGHGLDRIYPPEHLGLAQEILSSGGLLLSEYPTGTPPLKAYFPQRNRILSGLALGTLVIEGGERSGSLITAMCALEQGREVFALPGPFDDVGFMGNHTLIQSGAKLVTSAEEVLCELQMPLRGGIFGGRNSRVVNDLETLFSPLGGVATLEELFALSSCTLDEVLKLLEEGKEEGVISEIGFQKFVWVDSLKKKDQATPCQMGKDS